PSSHFRYSHQTYFKQSGHIYRVAVFINGEVMFWSRRDDASVIGSFQMGNFVKLENPHEIFSLLSKVIYIALKIKPRVLGEIYFEGINEKLSKIYISAFSSMVLKKKLAMQGITVEISDNIVRLKFIK